jgi:hypothetical protein
MQPTLPITIRKSFVGFVAIYLAGGSLSVALALAAIYLQAAQPDLALIMIVVSMVAGIGTLVQSYVYNISRIVLTATELDVINWNSLVSQGNAICEWSQVQDIDFKKGGIFSLIFDYGTLLIQTAGTDRNLRINYVPRVEHWRDYIAGLANK